MGISDFKLRITDYRSQIPEFTGAGCRTRRDGRDSGEELVEIVVGTDPDPDHGVAVALAHGTVLLVDPDGPGVFVAAEFFEAERRMIGVSAKRV